MKTLFAAVLAALPAVCFAAQVTITLLHTTDLHGWLRPQESGRGGEPAGGILRAASVIGRLRTAHPDALLIDCGDLFQGSPEARVSEGFAPAIAARHMGYDALVVGNHDLDWGAERARLLYAETGIPPLAGNIFSGGQSGAGRGLGAAPFLIREIKGVKIAVVGLTTPLIPKWLLPHKLGALRFENPVTALREILPKVRARSPDILVLAMHQGFSQSGDDAASWPRAIAEAFPDFDLMIGGHTHQAVETRFFRGIPFTQAGAHGRWVGRVEIRFDASRRRVAGIDCFLEPVEEAEEEDEILADLLAPIMRKTASVLAEPLGKASCDMRAESDMPGQSAIQTLLARAIAESAGVDAALHGALSGAGIYRGPVTRQSVWRIVPYENEVCVLELETQELRNILEDNARWFGSRDFRGIWGLVYEFNPDAPEGARIGRIFRADGRQLGPRDVLRLACNSHDAASAGGRFPVLRALVDAKQAGNLMKISGNLTHEMAADYILRRGEVCEKPAPGCVLPP